MSIERKGHISQRREPAGVVLLGLEDDLPDTVQPRLRRAGADLSRIRALCTVPVTSASGHHYERPFSLLEDLEVLAETIERVQARLVIVDAVMKLLGNKDPYDADKSVLLHTKSNISKLAPQLSFSVQDDEEQGERSPHVCWHGECHYSEADLNGASSRTGTGSCDTHKPTTARDEILRVLEEHAPDALSPLEVSEELPEIQIGAIRVTLTRLAKDGVVEQPSRGKYGVVTQ